MDFDEISRSSILNEDPNASAELKSQRVPATVNRSFVESIFHLRNKIAFLSKVWKISFLRSLGRLHFAWRPFPA